jgi:hypothetical protein
MEIEEKVKSYIEDVVRKCKLTEICGFDVLSPEESSKNDYIVVLFYSKNDSKSDKKLVKDRIFEYLGKTVEVLCKIDPNFCEENKKGQE